MTALRSLAEGPDRSGIGVVGWSQITSPTCESTSQRDREPARPEVPRTQVRGHRRWVGGRYVQWPQSASDRVRSSRDARSLIAAKSAASALTKTLARSAEIGKSGTTTGTTREPSSCLTRENTAFSDGSSSPSSPTSLSCAGRKGPRR